MSLHKYFTISKAPPAATESDSECLPKTRKSGRTNQEYTEHQRYKVGRYASENRNKDAVKKFDLPESTIRNFKKQYQQQLKSGTESCNAGTSASTSTNTGNNSSTEMEVGSSVVITPLPKLAKRRRGRKTLLPDKVDKAIVEFILGLRAKGANVSLPVILGAARGIVRKLSPQLLPENGGSLKLGKAWATSLMRRMNFSKRKATKAARKKPTEFLLIKHKFLFGIEQVVYKRKIPEALVVNLDQTAVRMVPAGNWTMAAKGSKQVPLMGLEDKREITTLLSIAADGHMLPAQVDY